MKVGILGDIHSNTAALAAVLGAATREGVTKLLITGDLVGYYFAAGEVVRALKAWDTVIVRGNHEDMLAAVRADPGRLAVINKAYGSSLALALEQLSESELETLCNLPHPVEQEIGNVRVLLCHGAPWDNDQYVYPDADHSLLSRCAVRGYDFVVMGHTHYPMINKVGAVTLVNPGSVGQPRNRRPGAQWAVLDTDTASVELRSEAYDHASVAAEARTRHPELPYLADVLTRR